MWWAGRKQAGSSSCLSQSSGRIALGLRSHCLGWWGHTGRDRSRDGVRRDRGCRAQAVDMPRASSPQPRLGVGLYPEWVLSPQAGMDTASLLGRESSVVWIHASNTDCFWGREEPGCRFWATCEVLRGTGLVAWPLQCQQAPAMGQGLSTGGDAEAEVVEAGRRLGAGDRWLGELGRETPSSGITQLQSQEGAA